MDLKEPDTLLDLAMQIVVKNESIVLRAVEEMPRELFIPLFNAAFSGAHKNILKVVVSTWPFPCLHVGALHLPEPYCDVLEAMLDGLQFPPIHNSTSCVSKLRVLDLRQNSDCMTTCSGIWNKFPFCYEVCAYSQKSIVKTGDVYSCAANLEHQLCRPPMELLVDLYLDSTWMTSEFLSLLHDKVEQSLGTLHLCCRDLQIDRSLDYKKTLKLLDTMCIDHLEVDEAPLSEVCTIMPGMLHLSSLNLYKIKFRSYKKKPFKTFLYHLKRMKGLQELSLTYFSLKNHVHKVLSIMSSELDSLNLNFCDLTNKDFISMAQIFQERSLNMLNLSHNRIPWENTQPVRLLLENLSGTLQHLELNSCFITDGILSSIIPSIRFCTRLQVFSFACNPITMSVLRRFLQNITSLMKLKFVTYPIPVHCYDQWHFHESLDEEKLAEVKSEVRSMLWAAQRTDMKWSTSYE